MPTPNFPSYLPLLLLLFVSLVFAVLCHVFCYLLPIVIFWSLIGCPMMWCRFVIGGLTRRDLYKDTAAFNVELIVGSVASGLRAPGALLRPMIQLD